MKFYTEDRITRYIPDSVYGYFYEAKDLTQHPFLDRYKEELIERLREDRTASSLLKDREEMPDTWPRMFAQYFITEARYVIERGWGYSGDFADIVEDANVTQRDVEKNFKWVIIKYVQGKIRLLEDIRTVAGDLVTLETLKKPKVKKDFLRRAGETSLGSLDVNNYASAAALSTAMNFVRDTLTEPEPALTLDQLVALGEAEIIYEDGSIVAFEVKTARACADTGSQGVWCTTTWAFDRYRKSGPLYTIHVKNSGSMYHFSFGEMEFTDEDNDPITHADVENLNLHKVFPNTLFDYRSDKREEALLDHWDSVYTMLNPELEELENLVEKKPELIEDIPHYQQGWLAHAAIGGDVERFKKYHHMIDYEGDEESYIEYMIGWAEAHPELVKSETLPDEAEIAAAIADPKMMEYISTELQYRALSEYDSTEELISHAAEEVQIEYLKKVDPEAINFIDRPPADVIGAFLQGLSDDDDYGEADIENLIRKVKEFDIKLLSYVKNPSLDLQLWAVEHDKESLDYIDNPHETVVKRHHELYLGQQRLYGI